MEEKDKPLERPLFVRIALWGLVSRADAWFFLWLSAALALVCVALGFVNRYFFTGSVFLLAALWYYLSIRWMDRHDCWH
jgi:hypothetical protein